MNRKIKKENIKSIAYSICAFSLCGAALFGFWESNKDNRKAELVKENSDTTFISTEPQTEKQTEEQLVNKVVTNVLDDRTENSTKEEITLAPVYFSVPLGNGIMKDFSKGELVKNATTGDWRTHNGADYKGVIGDPVKSICDGTVLSVEDDILWGTVVTVDHGNGITAIYKGLQKGSTVQPGDKVKTNDKIGNLSEIPIEKAEGPHLHLEILKNGENVSPKDYTGKTIQF